MQLIKNLIAQRGDMRIGVRKNRPRWFGTSIEGLSMTRYRSKTKTNVQIDFGDDNDSSAQL